MTVCVFCCLSYILLPYTVVHENSERHASYYTQGQSGTVPDEGATQKPHPLVLLGRCSPLFLPLGSKTPEGAGRRQDSGLASPSTPALVAGTAEELYAPGL